MKAHLKERHGRSCSNRRAGLDDDAAHHTAGAKQELTIGKSRGSATRRAKRPRRKVMHHGVTLASQMQSGREAAHRVWASTRADRNVLTNAAENNTRVRQERTSHVDDCIAEHWA